MAIIPNKLQRQTVNHKCKYVHKFRRFSKKNKTFLTDRYYCANCGHQVMAESIYGHQTICWRCGNTFNITMMKVYPTCPDCTGKTNAKMKVQFKNEANDWMEDKEKKENILDEMLNELGLK